MILRKGFWFIFASFSVFHLGEDMFWAFIARFTSVPTVFLFVGILFWALLSTIFVHSSVFKRYWKTFHIG